MIGEIVTFKPLIVITGATAVGKTALALQLAETINGEIIGADSRQIYRYMDIGTAKPSAQELARVPHHLIDIATPDETPSLAQIKQRMLEYINKLHECGKVPLLVGGTAQYINAVTEGWSIPEVAPNETLRAELEAFAVEHGSEALFQRLQTVDAAAAAKIEHHQNVRRVVRALEVYTLTGKPISELQRKEPPPYQIQQHVLTRERDTLYERADQRLMQMIDAGFVEEVRRLLEMGYDRRLPSMSGLGYAQLAAYLQGESTLDAAIEATRVGTHKFIRHQYTWFRKYHRDDVWHSVEQVSVAEFIGHIQRWLAEAAEPKS